MVISATDFQLRVNEYFMKMIQGEEIQIERYGKKFAVLIPYEQYVQNSKQALAQNKSVVEGLIPAVSETPVITEQKIPTAVSVLAETDQTNLNLSSAELTKLLKVLLAKL